MTLEEFKSEVIEKIKESDSSGLINSTCPRCYGSLVVPNTHSCESAWNFYFEFQQAGVTVKHIVNTMKQYKLCNDGFSNPKIILTLP